MTRDEAIKIAEEKYPIYTLLRPNPKTKKEDCAIDKMKKEQQRFILIKRLLNEPHIKEGIS